MALFCLSIPFQVLFSFQLEWAPGSMAGPLPGTTACNLRWVMFQLPRCYSVLVRAGIMSCQGYGRGRKYRRSHYSQWWNSFNNTAGKKIKRRGAQMTFQPYHYCTLVTQRSQGERGREWSGERRGTAKQQERRKGRGDGGGREREK